VDQRAQAAEAHVVEPVGDDVQGGALVAHEQHALPARQVVADDVGDRLALARARRAVQDQAGPLLGGLDRRVLAAVGVQDMVGPLGSSCMIQVAVFDEPGRVSLYSDAFLGELADAGLREPDEADPAAVLTRSLGVASRRDPVSRAMVADLLTYLPGDLLVKVDLASMAHGLECRSPFLDHRVVELALALPLRRKLLLRRGRSKVVLKQAFADLLPPAIRDRPKMGFGVPIDRWFRGALKDELRAVLLDPVALGRGLFRPEAVTALIEEHAHGRRDHAYRLWALLMLELWFRHHVDAPAS